MTHLLSMFAPKKKEYVAQIGGAMGDFNEEFEQGLEDKPNKGPQILGSITFNIPDFAPDVTEVVNAFYGLGKDILGTAEMPRPEQPPQVEQAEKEAIFVRDRVRALQEQMQRLTIDKQEDLTKDALRMGVNIIDVEIKVQKYTNPIQTQREQARIVELGIHDIVVVADEAAEQQEQAAEAREQQTAVEVKGPKIVIDQNAAAEGGMGRGSQHISPIAGAG